MSVQERVLNVGIRIMDWTMNVNVYIKPKKKNEPDKPPKDPLVWKIFNLMDIQTN